MELRERLAHSLRRERDSAGFSVSELARRAGVSKATISQLESGAGNPRVETLWAIGDALGVPFATLVEDRAPAARVIRVGDHAGVPSAAAPYLATLLSAAAPGTRRDIYLIQAEPGEPRRSLPHRAGTTEHVVMVSGEATVGPEDAPEVLHPGDYLSYAGDAAHIFEAHSPGTSAVLVSELR